MINPYIVELLAKERQRELDKELKRIYLARIARNPCKGILKKCIQRFLTLLIQRQVRYHPNAKPAMVGYGSRSQLHNSLKRDNNVKKILVGGGSETLEEPVVRNLKEESFSVRILQRGAAVS